MNPNDQPQRPQMPHKPAPRPQRGPQPAHQAKPVAAHQKPHTPKPSLLGAVRKLKELETALKAIGQPTHFLNPQRAALQAAIEAIPVNWDWVKDRGVMGFVLLSGEWFPFHVSEDCNPNNVAFAGGVFYAIRHDDGTASQGPCKPLEWAHCTADDHVNYHWLDAEDEPAPDGAGKLSILYEAAKLAKTMDRVEALGKLRELLGVTTEDEPDYSAVVEG